MRESVFEIKVHVVLVFALVKFTDKATCYCSTKILSDKQLLQYKDQV